MGLFGPGPIGFLPRAHFEFGGFQLGFQTIQSMVNSPRGVGCPAAPTVTGYVRITLPSSITESVRSDRSTSSASVSEGGPAGAATGALVAKANSPAPAATRNVNSRVQRRLFMGYRESR